ncbi:TolB family protein [Longimicrobium sp.]|uniref:TolB family protein n=1 Tax=Longimicrobium sp. TaxID=2029185 RepID=UPI003B3B106F
MQLIKHRALLLGVALSMAGACRTAPDPRPEPGQVGIAVISGAGQADTVQAQLPRPLVVEVRNDQGRPQAGVAVRFEAAVVEQPGFTVPMVNLSGVTPDNFQPAAEVRTDALGRAAVRVRLGTATGTATVRVTVPTLGFSTTAEYRVAPGRPARTVVLPADTAVYVGGSYALRAVVQDRAGTTTPVPLEAVASDDAAIATAGAAVTGVAVGRTRIMVTVEDEQVPVFVSVVPRGTLAAAGPRGVYVFGLDGSDYRLAVAAQGARSPRWLPDGRRFVFTKGTFGEARVSDLDGATQPLLRGSVPPAQLWTHPSRDGQWVYFGGYSGPEMRGYPYRVRADGTGVQLLPGFTRDDRNQSHPSVSPAGDRVVYFREEGDSRLVTLRILDLRTGRLVLRDVRGHAPEWSHGDSIAYLDPQGYESGPIRLMASDGTGARPVGDGESYGFGFDWSPDDRWIVAHDMETERLEIIHVATGQRVPLPYSAGLFNPAWKP